MAVFEGIYKYGNGVATAVSATGAWQKHRYNRSAARIFSIGASQLNQKENESAPW
jgi:hypothetical protein